MTDDVVPAGIVLPVRGFQVGKSRLSGKLDPARRVALLQWMAEQVLAAARPYPTVVVSSAPEVREWATSLGVLTMDDPGDLDAAATAGMEWARDRGLPRVVVVHADLPRATRLDHLAFAGNAPVALAVCSRSEQGTPVLSVPTNVEFTFAYGPGSFERHALEAARLGLGFEQIDDPSLAHDVDAVSDLVDLPADLLSQPAVRAALDMKQKEGGRNAPPSFC